jgi:hypothetical protein
VQRTKEQIAGSSFSGGCSSLGYEGSVVRSEGEGEGAGDEDSWVDGTFDTRLTDSKRDEQLGE